MSYRRKLIVSGFILTSATNLLAESPIKSIDRADNVTYSDRPTAGAASSTEVQIDAGPTESQVAAAKKRAQKIIESADKAQADRKALVRERQQQREKDAQDNAAQEPDVIGIENENRYPAYYPPPVSRPPVAIPPGGGPEHPVYRPPSIQPPIAWPLTSP